MSLCFTIVILKTHVPVFFIVILKTHVPVFFIVILKTHVPVFFLGPADIILEIGLLS